jgi:hypothetical protein
MRQTDSPSFSLARMAGVHVWLESDDALYADGQYVGVHAARDGLKVIHLPGQFRVYDAISDAPVGSDGPNVTLSMKRVQTMLRRLEPVD